MFDLFFRRCINSSLGWQLHGTDLLASLRKGCASSAVYPEYSGYEIA